MRQAFAVILSLSLNLSPLFAYDDYNDPNRNYGAGSTVNQFQNDWMTRNNWSNNFNDSAVFNRPAVQFPSFNFDLSFSNSSSNFDSYSKLDLNYNSNAFTTPSFTPQLVTQNFNFQANDFSSFTPSNTNRAFDTGRLSAQSFKQDTFSVDQNLRSQDLRLQDDFSRLPSNDFNTLHAAESYQPRQPATEMLQTFVTAPAKLATMAPEAVSVIRDSFNKLFTLPQPEKAFSSSLKTDPAISPTRQPGLFEGVAAVVKAIPALFAAVGAGIKNAVTAVWDRVVLGHRTVNAVTMADGSTLSGKITVNRKDEIVSMAQGTVRTVGQLQKTEDGHSILAPLSKAVSINGEDYIRGDFVYDGQKFNLQGRGIKLTTQAGTTLSGTQKVEQYVQGDGKGHDTALGYGPISSNDTFRESTTGFSFRGANGVWKLDANQAGTLKLDGKDIAIKIDDGGHLAEPVKAQVTDQKAPLILVTGILPNPETSGYQVMAVAKLGDKDTFKTGIPGSKPSQHLPDQINDWRQKTSALIRSNGFMSNSETEAKVHQEGDQYVFTGGHVAFVAATGPILSPSPLMGEGRGGGENTGTTGQKTLSTEAVLSGGSHLMVTGPTDFPGYGTKVITGKVDLSGNGRMNLREGSLYVNQEQGARLAVTVDGKEAAVPVKSLDLKAGTFVAVIPDIHEENGQYVKTGEREMKGRIDFENGRASLIDSSIKAPVYGPSQFMGVNAPAEVEGAAWITVRSNHLTVQLDKSGVGLDEYRKVDIRPALARPAYQSSRLAFDMYQDQGNPRWARATAFVAYNLSYPAVMLEDAYNFTMEGVASSREFGHYSALAYLDVKAGQKGDAALNSLCGVATGAESIVRLFPAGEMSVQTVSVLSAEVSSLTQSARELAEKFAAKSTDFAPSTIEPTENLSTQNPSTMRPTAVPAASSDAIIPRFHPDALVKSGEGMVRYKDIQLGSLVSEYPAPIKAGDGRMIYGEIIGEESPKGAAISDLFNSHPQGISIKGFTETGIDRTIDAGVKPSSILDTLRNPIKIEDAVSGADGITRQQFIGRESEVTVNLNTRQVVSVKPTSTSRAAELLRENGLSK